MPGGRYRNLRALLARKRLRRVEGARDRFQKEGQAAGVACGDDSVHAFRLRGGLRRFRVEEQQQFRPVAPVAEDLLRPPVLDERHFPAAGVGFVVRDLKRGDEAEGVFEMTRHIGQRRETVIRVGEHGGVCPGQPPDRRLFEI